MKAGDWGGALQVNIGNKGNLGPRSSGRTLPAGPAQHHPMEQSQRVSGLASVRQEEALKFDSAELSLAPGSKDTEQKASCCPGDSSALCLLQSQAGPQGQQAGGRVWLKPRIIFCTKASTLQYLRSIS